MTALYHELLERVSALPAVQSASLSRFGLIGAGYSGRGVSVPGFVPQSKGDQAAAQNVVSPRFFETMGIPVLLGRDFGPQDAASSPKVAVVSEKFARFYFRGESPIGKRFSSRGSQEPIEIIGLVGDSKYFRLRRESPRTVFLPFQQSAGGLERMILEVRTAANPTAMFAAIQGEIRSIDPTAPVHSLRTQQQQLDATLVQERLLATLAGFFSLVALLLTCVGLYGLLAYATNRRTAEIGIRLALGAQRRNVIWMVLRESLLLVAIGLAIGVPAALGAGRLVSKILFGVAPADGATLAASALLLWCVAALAAYLPARRAARLDPTVALRHG